MKKLISLSLALVMVFALCTACSKPREKVDLSQYTSLAQINGSGANLGAQSNTFHNDALKGQTNGVNTFDYPDFTTLLVALNSGAIDGYVAEEPTAWSVCLKDSAYDYVKLVNNTTGFTAGAEDVGVAVAFKEGSDKVAPVNEIIATITEAQRSALMQLMVQISEDVETATTTELPLVSTSTETGNGTLKIAMECAYQPFNWTQKTDVNGAVPIANVAGSYANGYDVQIAKYIAAELGMALEVYAYEWDSLVPAVQSSTVDGIIAGMSPTAEREELVDFTDCYWTSNLVIIYKK